MRKTREILRLHYELKLSQRQIAQSVEAGQSTISDCLKRFRDSSLGWPLPSEVGEAELEAALFQYAPRPRKIDKQEDLPDFDRLHEELQGHRNMTLQLLWEEYRVTHPDGYAYSRFCHHYQRWRRQADVVMRQQHRAGEKLFVDWAGAKIPISDRQDGTIREASVFVATLGASSYTYAEATWTQEMEHWIGAHIRAFEFLGGLPELVVPDNTRTAVARTHRYEPDLNPTYQEMAMHYGVGVVPARPRKPRDKAAVEQGVQVVQRWIVAALRHRKFFSLHEANKAIGELLIKLNRRPFRKREGSRLAVFEQLERPALRPLPATRFDLAIWSRATVNIDYHVVFEGSFYSVPYTLVRETVELRTTPAALEIFHRGRRVASHVRVTKTHTVVTNPEHRPKSHRAHLEWPPSRIVQWAQTVGPCTAELVTRIMASYPHPEMGYRSCLGILRLGKRYPQTRMEAASTRAIQAGALSYKSLESILRRGLDQQPLIPETKTQPNRTHDNLRGPQYFQ